MRQLTGAASPLFCLFVLALGIVVKAVVDNGLDAGVGRLLPHGRPMISHEPPRTQPALARISMAEVPPTRDFCRSHHLAGAVILDREHDH
jgi:hypothetical protein